MWGKGFFCAPKYKKVAVIYCHLFYAEHIQKIDSLRWFKYNKNRVNLPYGKAEEEKVWYAENKKDTIVRMNPISCFVNWSSQKVWEKILLLIVSKIRRKKKM